MKFLVSMTDKKWEKEKFQEFQLFITRLLFLEKWESNVSSSISHHSYHLEINLFHHSVGLFGVMTIVNVSNTTPITSQ